MNFSKAFLIEGNDLSNLIEDLLEATEEIIEASPDKRKGPIARARRLITKTVQALNTFDLEHAYAHAAAAYREATQQEQLPVDKKRIAGYRKHAWEVVRNCGPCRFNLEMCGYTRCGSKLVFWLDQDEEPQIRKEMRQLLETAGSTI